METLLHMLQVLLQCLLPYYFQDLHSENKECIRLIFLWHLVLYLQKLENIVSEVQKSLQRWKNHQKFEKKASKKL